jgi:hypothetical protein
MITEPTTTKHTLELEKMLSKSQGELLAALNEVST